MDGKLGQFLAEKIEERVNYRILGWFENGFRQISNQLRTIRTPADMKDMRIRVLPSEVQARTFELLGAVPLRWDLTEAIAAIKAGTIDAQENPFANTVTYHVHKFHHYHSVTNHFYISRPIFLHRDTFDAWPKDLQDAMREAVDGVGCVSARACGGGGCRLAQGDRGSRLRDRRPDGAGAVGILESRAAALGRRAEQVWKGNVRDDAGLITSRMVSSRPARAGRDCPHQPFSGMVPSDACSVPSKPVPLMSNSQVPRSTCRDLTSGFPSKFSPVYISSAWSFSLSILSNTART